MYIKSWKTSSDNVYRPAQKTQRSTSAYRDVSVSIGWIGSQFIHDNRAIVCGASVTPYGKVAAPSGRYFSDASEAAGLTRTVEAGGKVTLITAGNAGAG